MKKRFLSMFLAALIACSVFAGLSVSAVETKVASTASDETSGTTGDCTWNFDESTGTLTISGNGAMGDYYIDDAPWYDFKNNIKSVVIENGVANIGAYAFNECTSLTSIKIPDSVSSIGDSAFENCTSLTSITIPDSVTNIGYTAFGFCTGLTSITIPNSVTSIGYTAFGFCTGLTSIIIPDSVTTIEKYTFDGCTGLTSITIPDSVTSIGNYTFRDCKSLTSVTIPNSVTSIGKKAFYDCESLTSITIPDSVTSIGDLAFFGCTSLTSINVDLNNQYYSSVDGNFYNKEQSELIQYALGKNEESFTIPDTVTNIVDYAFYGYTSLKSIALPNSVTSIGEEVFYDCENLTSITIPDSVTSIGYCAFYGCNKLSDVYYKGTEEQWQSINFSNYNDNILNATIHYNFIEVPDTTQPTEPSVEETTATEPKVEETTATEPIVTNPQPTNPQPTTPVATKPVVKKTTVKLAKSSATLYRTGKTTIKATVKNGKGKTTYKSSNTKVAKVNAKGVVTAVKKGNAKITVTNNGIKKIFKVTVKNPKLNATKKTLKVKKSFTLKITGKIGKATFTSSNKKVATVNSKGKITAKKKGTTYITVKTNGIKLKCKVTVKK